MDTPYYGEQSCQAIYKSGAKKGHNCISHAYYSTDKGLFCGLHSNINGRVELTKNPNAKEITKHANITRHTRAGETGENNMKKHIKGFVICSKLGMRKAVPHVDRYYTIFPNFKHAGRQDGIGLKTLSPMYLGPVVHGQEGIPNFSNLENFWQFSKMYSDQTKESFERRRLEYSNAQPTRHNRKGEKPVGWVWNGKLLSYLDARKYYCCFYEELCRKEEEYKTLCEMVEEGSNLNIVGYDGRSLDKYEGESLKDKIYSCYRGDNAPFGHELCLVAMLTLKDDQLPWK